MVMNLDIRRKASGYYLQDLLGAQSAEKPDEMIVNSGANRRSVWTISSQGYDGTHFAVFPFKLIEPCILAGTSKYGACTDCGAPYRRVVEERKLKRDRPNEYVKRDPSPKTYEKSQNTPGKVPYSDKSTLMMNTCSNSVAGVEVKTVGWEKTCSCSTDEIKPCIVLDPFIGSGTTAVVSIEHGRYCWGIDLSEQYLKNNAVPRIRGDLMQRPKFASLAGKSLT